MDRQGFDQIQSQLSTVLLKLNDNSGKVSLLNQTVLCLAADWQTRIHLLKKLPYYLEEIVSQCSSKQQQEAVLMPIFQRLQAPISTQVMDLRSQVMKEAISLLKFLAQ